jgi:serine/threonine-protein kinase
VTADAGTATGQASAHSVSPEGKGAGASPVVSKDAGDSPRPSSTKTAKAKKVRFGTVVFKARPWATLYVDGRPYGEVNPSLTLRLPAGRHRVRMEHESGIEDSTVVVEAGKVLTHLVDFEQSMR